MMPGKPRILIVNCYFDHTRRRIARPWKVPQALAPAYLAGILDPGRCEVRAYSEVASGPLEDRKILSWPDMLVLTGLTNTFDRLLHLTAYARTFRPGVIVVAGGPAVRALPNLARRFFDYACEGDVEELGEVVRECFGPDCVAAEPTPRYEFAEGPRQVGYIETTRYCNFRCAFCALTGEGRAYQTYTTDRIRRQFKAMGRRSTLLFIDNNFYGNSRRRFHERLDLIRHFFKEGAFKRFGALVTNDFFTHSDNLEKARAAGCEQLFCGVESFDADWLARVQKTQNSIGSQLRTITTTLESGVLFAYGLLLDVYSRSVRDLRSELEFILDTPEITLPAFTGLPIPILGTPLFHRFAQERRFLPSVKLRDMDSSNLVAHPVDSIGDVTTFVDDILTFRRYRGRVLRHARGFARRYYRKLKPYPLAVALGNSAMLCAESAVTGALRPRRRDLQPRTFISSNEALDPTYRPFVSLPSRYESYFRPILVTDPDGQLTDTLEEGMASPGTSFPSEIPVAMNSRN